MLTFCYLHSLLYLFTLTFCSSSSKLDLLVRKLPIFRTMAKEIDPQKHKRNFMSSEIVHDVEFLVGNDSDKQRFSADKAILAFTSPVFESMLFSDLAKKDKEEAKKPIEVPDIEPAIFQQLLDWIYLSELNFTSVQNAIDILYAARKYCLVELEKSAVDYLTKNLSVEHVFAIAEAAQLFSLPELEKSAQDFFSEQTIECLNSDSFLKTTVEVLEKMFALDRMKINSEIDLFRSLEKFVEANPDKADRDVIGVLINKIQFLQLKVEEFAETAARSPLLTDAEKIAIFIKISTPKSEAWLDVKVPNSISSKTDRSIYKDIIDKIEKSLMIKGNQNKLCGFCYNYHENATFLWTCSVINVKPDINVLNNELDRSNIQRDLRHIILSNNKRAYRAVTNFIKAINFPVDTYFDLD